MKKSILLFILMLSMLSCTNDKLSSEEALRILKSEFKESCNQALITKNTYYYGKYYQRVRKKNSYFSSVNAQLKALQQKGYISPIETIGNSIQFNLTHKAKAYKYKEKGTKYKIAESEVIAVTGIAENENTGTAIVTFTYRFKPTPLYNLRYYKYESKHKDNCGNQTIEHELEFIKFDTGWKLKTPNKKSYF